ncbi:Retrovirus-related Pol polyprotein from transposon RE2 [Vitis vinifera]|uniref:Retrovirus-related Pol polyprotein from transposon RE2 n=1 Tax=Vitis vinifera TaxID=29760 RepID=A0A438DT15_VITVI|nr:Retrovirus-related Pol polyprotein from transposon RE2 [Vitis vinifera]
MFVSPPPKSAPVLGLSSIQILKLSLLSASVELWFMGQGYEDHLVTQEADIPEVDRVQWRKIDAQLCSVLWQSVDPRILLHLQAYKTCFKFWTQAKGLYTNDIQRLYKVASAIVHLGQQDLDLSTYIVLHGPYSYWLRPDLEPIRDQILGSSSVPSLDDVFARLLRLSSTQTLPSASASDSSVLVFSHYLSRRTQCTRAPSSSASQTSQASIASVAQSGNASACLTHTSSLGPWILDSGASDHLSGIGLALPLPSLPLTSVLYTPECPFNLISISKITRTLNCSITFSDKFVTLQDRSTGKTIGIGRESQGLYHLTSDSSPAVCISTDAPLLIHNRLGHPSLSKFQKMVPCFSTLLSLPCESCQLGKHTRVSFPKRLNNRAKSPLSLSTLMFGVLVGLRTTLGFQYFVTFIDDYSRLTMPGNIFQPNLLRLCLIMEFFISLLVLILLNKNGVAERKNRHLVRQARTLLLHSHIPHSLLFPDQPLYFLPPRVFGYFRRVIVVIPLRLIGTLSPLMSPSLRTHHSFPPLLSLFPFLKSCPFPLSPHLKLCPLDHSGYHRRPRVVAPLPFPEAPADSLPIPSASLPPALPSPHDLPIAVRKSTHEALSHPGWRQAMVDEMAALHSNGTWDLVVLPPGKSTVGCRWVYAVKVGPDDCFCRLLLSMAAMCSWPLYQLDIKNAFLHGDLVEEVYMEQPPGFVAQGESGLVCRLRRSLYGLKQSPRAWFSRFSSVVQEFGMLRMIRDGIQKLKQHLFTHFQTKDLGKLKYFLEIEINSIQFWCGPFSKEVCFRHPGRNRTGEPLGDPGRYRRLVGKLNYLTITRPDISFPVSVVSQFLQSPCDSHWDAVIRILRYIKSTPGQGVLYENRGHTQVVGYTDADWAGSPTDRRSTSDIFFRSCDLGKDEQMKLICDNQAALHIASNPVFHERTKHIEVDCHFIREKIASGCVATSFVNSNDQLADIFTKSLRGPRIKYICNKLGAYDVYAPA